jgi:hypothetical protein
VSEFDTAWYSAGGTLAPDAPSYVVRAADAGLLEGLLAGDFCYVLTARQMGKSSLVARTARTLRQRGVRVVALDLQLLGKPLCQDIWYNDLATQLGAKCGRENEAERWWRARPAGGVAQRLLDFLREVILPAGEGPLVVFVDEVDAVRGFSFSADEFFIAIRKCYNARAEDPAFRRLAFCVIGVATPAELIRDPRLTPFQIGQRIVLDDFTPAEAQGLAAGLGPPGRGVSAVAGRLVARIMHWTDGHPHLTQRLCREVMRHLPGDGPARPDELVDAVCGRLFLHGRARDEDDLACVRDRILHSESDVHRLLGLYREILMGVAVADDEHNDLVNQLRLAGIVKSRGGRLVSRNRIYAHAFDVAWIEAMLPDAELERPDGARVRLGGTCSIGRVPGNALALADSKVSRQHALIRVQNRHEFWLMDLGSSNGTFLNERRVTRPERLQDGDWIEIGPFRLRFRQSSPAEFREAGTPDTVTRV